jgi:hypothetical protein
MDSSIFHFSIFTFHFSMQAQLAGLKFNREWLVFRRGDSRIARIATRHTRTVKNPVITRKARSISSEVIYLIPRDSRLKP